jgi:hypothetical protein
MKRLGSECGLNEAERFEEFVLRPGCAFVSIQLTDVLNRVDFVHRHDLDIMHPRERLEALRASDVDFLNKGCVEVVLLEGLEDSVVDFLHDVVDSLA